MRVHTKVTLSPRRTRLKEGTKLRSRTSIMTFVQSGIGLEGDNVEFTMLVAAVVVSALADVPVVVTADEDDKDVASVTGASANVMRRRGLTKCS